MKKILFLLAMMPMLSYAQNKFSYENIKKLEIVVSLAKLEAEVSSTKSIYDIKHEFDNKVDTAKNVEPIIKANKRSISEMYFEMYDSAGKNNFELSNHSWKPELLNYNIGKVLIFNSIIYTSVFNTRVLDKRQRAKYIVENISNLIYRRIAEKVDTKIQYIGLCIAYCSKDFGKENESNKGDCIIVVAPSNAIKSFGKCQMSEDDFCKECDYYLSDRDDFNGIRRIDLKVFE